MALPVDRYAITRWRKRTGAGGPRHFERVTIDTTVQPKAVTRPTDSKLLHRGVAVLRRLARWHGIVLRQSCARISTHARLELARLIHRGCHREA
ncbi:hypothetical protein [Teichococcus vastitatis]|jgi:IS5 family transposase|uniref:Transposase DDE domain-containing protein n=1 Tax=Teichococcus vastitatis TaxID=2307076 RepID=A0ABS9W8U0_9PROT|nr:hypothetical protein [Pseudoroseomonas vastitatis]MCI0755716.1 hypothetical protein [Pseudoroseomonas vastitatis]